MGELYRIGALVSAFGLSLSLGAAEPAMTALVTVDAAKVTGVIKPMHAVNNGPGDACCDFAFRATY